ncbi:MAG TPA: oligosaccharide flippase family protein [Amycolatopsis sp.]|uniref:lipopolysaccharide biosynthesis protein n=1 Tax=Amycolatopsis sp. TaxID=37632 RepID=UPI002B482A72|nr:oligosaccharide flippase family protein [Amycolatopsis sp.]HKS45860.1 oligosaccharide flippase family protein [Amycolatopsis sp.]
MSRQVRPHQPAAEAKESGLGRGMLGDGVALSASTAISALAGMFGWILAARLLPAADVGHASAFISGMLLVAGIAELGLGPAVLRWLPRAGHFRRRLLRNSYLVVSLGGLVGAMVFVLVPEGRTVVDRVPAGALLFIPATICWTLFQFQDSVLTGLERPRWVLVENTFFGLSRLVFLGVLAPLAGALALLLSWMVPTALCVFAVTVLVFRLARPDRTPGTMPDRREVFRLLAPTYPATVCVVALYNLVPLIMLHRFGPGAEAVFFVVWTAINALDLAATVFVNPLVVRLSAEPGHARGLVVHTAVRLALVFVPALLAGGLLAGVLLGVFGEEYSQGADLFRVLLCAQLPRLVVVLGVAVHLGAGRGLGVARLHAVTTVAAVGLALVMPSQLAFGVGLLAAQCGLAAAVLVGIRAQLRGART